MTDKRPSTTDMLDHAWRYFELHANQRMSVFNFFIVISALVATGMAASLRGRGVVALVGTVLGFLLALVSFIFWKLDQRVSFLLKHAESALSALEASLPELGTRLFAQEPELTARRTSSGSVWSRHWSYGRSFRTVFLAMGIFGVAGGLLSLILFVAELFAVS